MQNESAAVSGNLVPYHDLTDFPAEYVIQVNNCGVKQNYPIHQDIFRPVGRQDYSILYVSSGWIHVSHKNEMVQLNAGNCILYRPGASHINLFSSEGHPVVYYVYFTGTGISEIMDMFEPAKSLIFNVENGTSLQALFHRMDHLFRPLKVLNGRRPVNRPAVSGLLLQIIDLLLESTKQKATIGNNSLLPAMTYLTEHYHEQITLEDCARTVQLSVGRFGHLFTDYYGVSPHKFLLSLRLDEAKELLANSIMSINMVAEKTGFLDPCYFSRLFRKYTGLTPKEYREKALDPSTDLDDI